MSLLTLLRSVPRVSRSLPRLSQRPAQPLESRGRTLAGILLLSLVLKLSIWTWVVVTDRSELFLNEDSRDYHHTARSLLEGSGFALSPEDPDVPQVRRTPGLPLFLFAVYSVLGENPAAAVLVQILVSLIPLGIVYWMVHGARGPRVAELAVLLLALDTASLSLSLQVLSETLSTVLLGASLVAAVHYDRGRHRPRWALALGFFLAATTLVRPTSYFLFLPIALWVVLVASLQKAPKKKVFASLMLFVLPAVLLIGGWRVRNWSVTGDSHFCAVVGEHLFFYKGAGIVALRDGIHLEQAQQRLGLRGSQEPAVREWQSIRQNEARQRQTFELVTDHPLLYLRMVTHGMGATLLSTGEHPLLYLLGFPLPKNGGPLGDLARLDPGDYWRKWVEADPWTLMAFLGPLLHLAILYTGVAGWLGTALRTRRFTKVDLLLWGVLLYFLLATAGPSGSFVRRVPVIPILCLYSALGWGSMLRSIQRFQTVPSPWREILNRQGS